MRTDMLFDAALITARCRHEDHLRAVAAAEIVSTMHQRERRHRAPIVRFGQALVQIGERLQAVAEQPA